MPATCYLGPRGNHVTGLVQKIECQRGLQSVVTKEKFVKEITCMMWTVRKVSVVKYIRKLKFLDIDNSATGRQNAVIAAQTLRIRKSQNERMFGRDFLFLLLVYICRKSDRPSQ